MEITNFHRPSDQDSTASPYESFQQGLYVAFEHPASILHRLAADKRCSLGSSMLAIPLYLLFAGVTVWGFFEPRVAGWVYLGTAALFAAWLLLESLSLRSKWIPKLDQDSMSKDEVDIFKKYAFYFVYPHQAKQYSGTFSLIQILCIVWLGLALWNREWVFVACIVGLFFGATNMAPYLNQGNFLRHHGERGNLPPEMQERLALVEAVESKILEARGIRRDA